MTRVRRPPWLLLLVAGAVVGVLLLLVTRLPGTGGAVGGRAADGPAVTSGPAVLPVPPHDDTGVVGGERLPDAARADVQRAAERFAREWSTPGAHWSARVAELASAQVAAALSDADPVRPAPRVTAEAQLIAGAPQWARARVPTDRGDLVLDLVHTDLGWQVSAVDWQRS